MGVFTPPPDLEGIHKAAWILTIGLRVLVAVVCALMIIAFSFLIDSALDSDKLNFMGQLFAFISNLGYIVISFFLMITQLEIEFLHKHLTTLYYWPVKASLMVFMGVQVLNSRVQLKAADLDSDVQVLMANFAGYTLVVCGLTFLLMSCARLNRADLAQFKAQADYLVQQAHVQNPEAKKNLGDPLLNENQARATKVDTPAPYVPSYANSSKPEPSTSSSMAPRVVGEEDSYPFSTVGKGPPASSIDPDPFGAPRSSQYTPPTAVGIDDDIQNRRANEEDELERMYANAAQGSGKRFEAAD